MFRPPWLGMRLLSEAIRSIRLLKLLPANQDFCLADYLLIQEKTVFVRTGVEARANGAAFELHPGWGLKDV